jgi:GNAT superfamily N-acetyltransferase
MTTYPEIEPTSATLKNGLAVTIRPLHPADRAQVADFVRGLDAQTVYTRLFSHRKELTEAGLDRIMRVDPQTEVALVVTTAAAPGERIIGSARSIVLEGAPGARTAEIAFTVEEDFQGLGIASRLLKRLAEVARGRGITGFEADVLAENTPMLRTFERSGLPLRKRSEGGIVRLMLDLA